MKLIAWGMVLYAATYGTFFLKAVRGDTNVFGVIVMGVLAFIFVAVAVATWEEAYAEEEQP